ncbi:DNA-binding protein [Leifsonia sp. C5G2]|uniref:DNA-binding protein n=1 Tax=Leifsonia sp. C5G2 TaxID=2735269 RepID=UPI001584CCA5|nr:DNA-binding protein [Leifsonia sp. C5G2]NUU06433.1 DNA-binding protein [Leifsonia sp. C5G2]
MSIEATPEGLEASVHYLMDTARSQGRDEELVIALIRESADVLKRRQPRGGALTEEQVAFLIESGTFTPERLAEVEASVARGDLAELERRTRLEAVTGSLSAAEAAQRLGIDSSRVRHRLSKGGLIGFMIGGKRRLPAWQFTDDPKQPVLPGLSQLIAAVPADMHPASLQNFMATPQEDLLIDGREVTPVEWLRLGGDPQEVVDILDSFLQS